MKVTFQRFTFLKIYKLSLLQNKKWYIVLDNKNFMIEWYIFVRKRYYFYNKNTNHILRAQKVLIVIELVWFGAISY